ncbi:hypothetical protein EYE40_14140 [Glaciihabitans arcticus]|uniref:Uncharacterized protein n=1 Tax=Glaciihabitans arcticus TaxID=2668039 RepID=A0A4Q9H143_9MICO|nr:hypothetical protein [Glaciihabitans arcticus]TBN58440.1 hypothetical protein EYE40_14140 [Glaciihabitans arcticus]
MAQRTAGIEVFRPLSRSVTSRSAAPAEQSDSGTWLMGACAALLALLFAAVQGYAIVAVGGGDYSIARTLATVAIVGTVITGLLGLVALLFGFGRRWGAIAVVLSILANPLALTRILGVLDTISS